MQFVQMFRYAIGNISDIKSGRDVKLLKRMKDTLPKVKSQVSDIILVPNVIGVYQLTKFVPNGKSEENAAEELAKQREEGVRKTASALEVYDTGLSHDLIQIGYDPNFRLEEIELLMGRVAKDRIKIVPYDSLTSAHKKPVGDIKEMMELHQQRRIKALREMAKDSLCHLIGREFDRTPLPECRELYRYGCELLESIRLQFGLTQDEYNALIDCRKNSNGS